MHGVQLVRIGDAIRYGIPLLFLTMHNTKNTVEADMILDRLSKTAGGAPDRYIAFNGSWFGGPGSATGGLLNDDSNMQFRPCILV